MKLKKNLTPQASVALKHYPNSVLLLTKTKPRLSKDIQLDNFKEVRKFEKKKNENEEKLENITQNISTFFEEYKLHKKFLDKDFEKGLNPIKRLYKNKGYQVPEISKMGSIFNNNPLLIKNENIRKFHHCLYFSTRDKEPFKGLTKTNKFIKKVENQINGIREEIKEKKLGELYENRNYNKRFTNINLFDTFFTDDNRELKKLTKENKELEKYNKNIKSAMESLDEEINQFNKTLNIQSRRRSSLNVNRFGFGIPDVGKKCTNRNLKKRMKTFKTIPNTKENFENKKIMKTDYVKLDYETNLRIEEFLKMENVDKSDLVQLSEKINFIGLPLEQIKKIYLKYATSRCSSNDSKYNVYYNVENITPDILIRMLSKFKKDFYQAAVIQKITPNIKLQKRMELKRVKKQFKGIEEKFITMKGYSYIKTEP